MTIDSGNEERKPKPIEFDRNDQVQDQLMRGEKDLGFEVSNKNRIRKSSEQKSSDVQQDNIQLPSHPLLGQKYDGLADGESIPANNIDTKLEIIDNLEAHPELVPSNRPDLIAALENRKTNELIRRHSSTPELKAG